MGVTDKIEAFITELLKNEEDEWLELGRNELAQIFTCVPSQINYVIRTRFSPERGYIVQSRRGGGGYLRIKKIENTPNALSVGMIGDEIDFPTASALIRELLQNYVIDQKTADIMSAAVCDRSLTIPQPHKNTLRANILKNMLITLQNQPSEF